MFDFSKAPLGQAPPGFRSLVAGQGDPGEWKILLDDVAPALQPFSSNAPVITQRAVLAQTSRQAVDNRFPILLFDLEDYEDFKLTTRFKVVGGALEEMAGVVFRFQNESNFYVARASVLGKNFRCYKVEDGVIRPPIGPEVEIPKNAWQELSVQCEGTRIVCSLNGKELIKLVDSQSSRARGKIGFWTMSDSVSYFSDARIEYTSREVPAQALIRTVLQDYPRVLGIDILAGRPGEDPPAVVASTVETEIGKPGGAAERDVIQNAKSYYGKNDDAVILTLPLRDRNGDPIAALRLRMASFPGQTQANALARAQPILKQFQSRVQSIRDLLQEP